MCITDEIKKTLTIYPFMINELKLKGKELYMFALIFKFTYYSPCKCLYWNEFARLEAFEYYVMDVKNNFKKIAIKHILKSLEDKKYIVKEGNFPYASYKVNEKHFFDNGLIINPNYSSKKGAK